jgi:hypothetical protein
VRGGCQCGSGDCEAANCRPRHRLYDPYEPNRLQPELTTAFLKLATSEGYRQSDQRVFYDYNGRPVIEVFKLFRP